MCGIFMEKKTFINRMADAANMPKDVVLGVPILTVRLKLLGNHFKLTITQTMR